LSENILAALVLEFSPRPQQLLTVILGHKEYAGQRTHIYDIIEPYWKSLWGGNAQHNEAA